jgi:hypothetical protein
MGNTVFWQLRKAKPNQEGQKHPERTEAFRITKTTLAEAHFLKMSGA